MTLSPFANYNPSICLLLKTTRQPSEIELPPQGICVSCPVQVIRVVIAKGFRFHSKALR